MNDKELFREVLNNLTERYPHVNVAMDGTMVMKDGEIAFNTDGWSLLYNLTRLCNTFKEEIY